MVSIDVVMKTFWDEENVLVFVAATTGSRDYVMLREFGSAEPTDLMS